MSGDTTIQALKRLTHLPDRDADKNGDLIAGQDHYDVEFTGGALSNVTITDSTINGVSTSRTERVITAAGDVTVASDDYIITMNKTVSQITTIPLPADPATSKTLIIKDGKGDADAFNITIDGNGKNIDGGASFLLSISYEAYELVYNGTQWNVINSFKTDGDVVGPLTATDNAVAIFDGTSGNVIQDTGDNLTVDIINNRVGVGINPPTHQLHVELTTDDNLFIDGRTNPRTITLGAMRQEHTAGIAGTRAYHIDIDSAGFDDTSGIVMRHNLLNSSAIIRPKFMNLQADVTGATNAHLNFLEFAITGTLDASMRADAIDIRHGITPIHHHSGTTGAADIVFKFDDSTTTYTDITTEAGSAGSDISVFDEINDYVYWGDANKFGTIEVVLATPAGSPGIKADFEYSKGSGAWGILPVSDDSNGFRENGNIFYAEPSDWDTDTVNAVASKYWVRLKRTSNCTAPIEDTMKIASDIEYEWDKNGNVNLRTLLLEASGALALTADSNGANTVPIAKFENTAGSYQVFRGDATPEGSVTASIGDKFIDSTNGTEYIKETGTATNTGWISLSVPVATDTILGKMSGDNNVDFKVTAGAIGFSDTVNKLKGTYNGFFAEPSDIQIVESGGTVSLTLEKDGGGDLTMVFSDGYTNLDCTPILSVALTNGTDVSPTLNYIYIPVSTKILTVSTTSFPASAQYIHIASVFVQSATSVATDGVYKNHGHQESPIDENNQGHESLTNAWIRFQSATWKDGVVLTPTITTNGGAIDNLDIETGSGNILQLHSHTFPAFDTSVSSEIYNINDPTTAYNKITDLNAVDQDSAGLTLRDNNDYYNLVIWGVVSEGTGVSKLFVNSPTGKYNTSTAAINDGDNTSNYNIPDSFRGTGFLIARLTIRYKTSSSGTLIIEQNEKLTGEFPSTFSGGTASTTTEFLDNAFRIQEETDPTKEIAFQASGITTATTRTITMPDANVNLGNITPTQGGTGIQTYTAGDILYASASNTLSKLAKGSDDEVLTLASGVPSWAAAGGGDFVLLGTGTASASASLDFTSLMSSTYSSYRVEFEGIYPTSSSAFYMRVSTDNGSSWKSGASDYTIALNFSNYFTTDTSWNRLTTGAIAQFQINPGLDPNAVDATSGSIDMFDTNSTTAHPAKIFVNTFWKQTTYVGAGRYNNVGTAVNAIQFFMSTGTIAAGTIRLYGRSAA